MPRKRRSVVTFSLSFLDIMSCGFGAVVLLFLIIKHNAEAKIPVTTVTPELSAEVNLLEREVLEGTRGLAETKNTIAEIDQQIVTAEGLARRIQEKVEQTADTAEQKQALSADEEIAALRTRIKDLENKKKQLETETAKTGEQTRSYAGEGTRQYLTGLEVTGNRILVLLDTSASMLDETIVNIIRRKHMTGARRTGSAKWKQAVAMVDWLSTRFPVGGNYQIYAFNTEVRSVLPGTEGKWLQVSDTAQLNSAIAATRDLVPDGGTSLERAFMSIRGLQPQPDSIYLVTDGLPTQALKPPLFGTNVSGAQRLKLFSSAVNKIPAGIPVHTILGPMEGDPKAAFAFWGLAIATGGSFMSPAADWP